MSVPSPSLAPLPSSDLPPVAAALAVRRSVPAAALTTPAPSPAELAVILELALRVPDHGIREPWRLVVIEGDARAEIGRRLAPIYRTANTAMEAAKREKFAGIMERLFLSAPMAVVVISAPDRDCAIPVFEQELSAGALCMNLLTAVHGFGYAGMWVTGWAATHPDAVRVLGARDGERIAGIVHLGTAKEVPPDRPRPDSAERVTRWTPPD